MSDSNSTTVAPDTDDLSDFENLFYGKAQPAEEVEVSETPQESEEQEIEDGDDTPAETEIDEEKEEEETPQPEKKKSRFQERIDDLTGKAKEAERREAEAQRRLEEALSRLEKLAEPKAEPKEAIPVQSKEPQPDETLSDGTPKYPLGEFDPAFVKDLAKFTFEQEKTEFQKALAAEKKAEEDARKQAAQQADWNSKTEKAVETFPDFKEKVQALVPITNSLPKEHGDFLAETIMSMDDGLAVLYHLAGNLEEAKAILSLPPLKAAIALGRVEARYALHQEENKEKRLKVSNAPPPPERLNKGTSVSKKIAGDEDDLEAFEQEFFAPKRKRF